MGDAVTYEVNSCRKSDIARNHTATHLLHAALKSVLGGHVNQAGSYVGPDRLRFDFSHFSPVTEEELSRVEAIVNEEILAAKGVTIEELPIEEAKNVVRWRCLAKNMAISCVSLLYRVSLWNSAAVFM